MLSKDSFGIMFEDGILEVRDSLSFGNIRLVKMNCLEWNSVKTYNIFRKKN